MASVGRDQGQPPTKVGLFLLTNKALGLPNPIKMSSPCSEFLGN